MDDVHARAVEEARLVLDARQELYGESDPATFDAMLQFGRALRDAGDLRQAEQVLTASLSLQHRSGDGNEAGVRWTEFNLAIVLDRLGEHEAARRRWEQVLASSDRDDGFDSELSRQTAVNLAITLRKLRRYGDEFPLRVRVLDSARRRLGSDDPETIRAEIDLAQTHRHLGNHELALGLFAEALAGLERTGGDQRTDAGTEVGHGHGAGGPQAVEGRVGALRRGRRRRCRAPGARRPPPAQRRAPTAGVLVAREVLRAWPQGPPRRRARNVEATR